MAGHVTLHVAILLDGRALGHLGHGCAFHVELATIDVLSHVQIYGKRCLRPDTQMRSLRNAGLAEAQITSTSAR